MRRDRPKTEHSILIVSCALITMLLTASSCVTRENELQGVVEHHRRALRIESIGSSNVIATMSTIQRRIVMAGDRSIPIQLFVPRAEGPLPTVLLLPSSDFVAGDIVTHDRIARTIAAETPAIVVTPEPATAPETDWATILDQIGSVVEWIPTNIGRWNGRSDCIVLIGEGSGGAQAAAISSRYVDQLALVVLVLPVLDLRKDAWTQRPWYAEVVAPNEREAEQRSPLARLPEDAPPTYVLIGSDDPARGQGMAWADHLDAIDVPNSLREIPDQGPLGTEWNTSGGTIIELVLDIAREMQSICGSGGD